MERQTIFSNRKEFSFNRSVYKSMGYSDRDLERPLIGIANAYSTAVPGHYNLKNLAEYVKNGIYRGGGTAVEFGVIGVCDGAAQGHEGMYYSLPSRELLANDIETMVKAHGLDAVVMLGSCDKTVPGMLMAAARLDIPAILLPGGPMSGGIHFDGRRSDLTSVSEAVGLLNAGKISQEEFENLEETCCSSCGSCSFYGTANTMCSLAEALGMVLPGGALTPASHPDRLRLASATGEAICELARKGITARQIITKDAVENAIRVCLTTSGSTNAVLHLSALAYEAEIDMSVIDTFEAMNPETPITVKVNPASAYDMEDFYHAGGVPRVLEAIRPLLHMDAMTVTGKFHEENLKDYHYKYPENSQVIRTMDDPFQRTGGLAVVRGNIAPGTGLTKPGAIDPSVLKFTGRAIVFDCEEEAEEAILAGRVKENHVVVIRYEGPKGGPGMREMYKAMKYLHGLGLDKSTALITDGRFSGTNNGCFVGHISPEAACGGPIAIIQDGDMIELDIPAGRIHLCVDQAEIDRRMAEWKPKAPRFRRGYLSMYASMVSSAAEGAIITNE